MAPRFADLLLEFAASDDVAGVCEGLARAVARATNAAFAAVVAADADDGSFDAFGDARAPWRFLAHLQGTFNRTRHGGDPAQRAYVGLNAVIVADVQADDACREGFAATAAVYGVRAVVAVPIIADGACAGVAAAYFTAPQPVDDAIVGTLRTIAAHGAAALARARRYERLEDETAARDVLVAESAEGICTFDDALRVGLWNRAAERITGVSAAALAGKTFGAAFARVDATGSPESFTSFEALSETFAGAPAHTIEVSLHNGRTEPVWLSMAGALVGGRSHRRSLVCCFRDITEQKRLEALRREFVSLVTHQLRTPLTAIRGYAELLGAVEMPASQVMEFGNVIANASTRLARSITDVMDFERLIASRDGLTISRIRLSEALDAALAAVEIPPHHSVRMPESASQIVLNADLDRLSRAFAHLIGNALRYWPDGGEVVVEASSTEKRVNVAIVDRGPGIPEDATGDLFSPFHHARRGNAVAGQGLGLGLSLTKRIVEAHGGQIAVEKTPGGGTTVRLWLPVG
jgi:PAS domain S-box-containing protein